MSGKVHIDSNTHPLTRSQVYPPSNKCHVNIPFLRIRYQVGKTPKSHANIFYDTRTLTLSLCSYKNRHRRLCEAFKWMFKTCSLPFPQKPEHIRNLSHTVLCMVCSKVTKVSQGTCVWKKCINRPSVWVTMACWLERGGDLATRGANRMCWLNRQSFIKVYTALTWLCGIRSWELLDVRMLNNQIWNRALLSNNVINPRLADSFKFDYLIFGHPEVRKIWLHNVKVNAV